MNFHWWNNWCWDIETGLKKWSLKLHPVSCVCCFSRRVVPNLRLTEFPAEKQSHFPELAISLTKILSGYTKGTESRVFPFLQKKPMLVCWQIFVHIAEFSLRSTFIVKHYLVGRWRPGSSDPSPTCVSSTKGTKYLSMINWWVHLVGSQQSYKQRNFRLMATNDCREYLVTKHLPWAVRVGISQWAAVLLCTQLHQDSDVINY